MSAVFGVTVDAPPPAPRETQSVLLNIQMLRAAAATLVVVFHLKELAKALGLDPHFLSFAALGVDLFFVISGFIMVFTTDRAPTTGLRFIENRIARVAPLYWLVTLFVFGIALAAPVLLSNTPANWLDLARSLAFIPYRRGDGLMLPVLFLGWSLNYEMFFYLIFALALWLGGRRHVALSITVILVFVAVGFIFRQKPETVLAFYTNPKMLEFAAGMLIARLVPRLPALRWSAILGIAIGAAWLFATPLISIGVGSTMNAIGASSLILISSLCAERGGMVGRHPFLVLLGDASYSLYLIHPLVTQAVVVGWRRLGGDPLVALVAIPAALILSIAAAILTYRLIEAPLSKVTRRLLRARRSEIPAGGL